MVKKKDYKKEFETEKKYANLLRIEKENAEEKLKKMNRRRIIATSFTILIAIYLIIILIGLTTIEPTNGDELCNQLSKGTMSDYVGGSYTNIEELNGHNYVTVTCQNKQMKTEKSFWVGQMGQSTYP